MTPIPPEYAYGPPARILQLLTHGATPQRVTAIGRWLGTWTADDVRTVAEVLKPKGKKPPTQHSNCGNRKGYGQHYRAGEQACRPCLDAQRAYRREYLRGQAA